MVKIKNKMKNCENCINCDLYENQTSLEKYFCKLTEDFINDIEQYFCNDFIKIC